ncbi:MAG: rane protein [Chitinophagaceae bacterium]|nr:rane protein [Chitinophagaceae bacterium]
MQIDKDRNYQWNKIPQLTLLFWIMKITATTLGETGGDLLAQTLNVGYATSTLIFFAFFIIMLICQLISKRYIPAIYWAVIVATSTAGTTMSDYMDRTLKLGYTTGTIILVSILIIVLVIWRLTEKSLSVTEIRSRRGEIFYWTAILFSNTLGTALGDFLADDSGLGFGGSALLISGVLALIILAYYFTKISRIILFWIAFVLTRPFGATFGDLLTKSKEKGGMDYGTKGASLILFILLIILGIYESIRLKRESQRKLDAESAIKKTV